MSTPHNKAEKGDIAKIVLMPGDPLRAKRIADTFLENPRQVNDVRNMFGYTGKYHGKDVTVFGSGMGMPSIGIYSYELYKFYDVETIIRIGSAGSYTEKLDLFDVCLVESAFSNSTYAKEQSGCEDDILYPDDETCAKLRESARSQGIALHSTRAHSSDVFYAEDNMPDFTYFRDEKGCDVVEMESFALYHNAKVLGKKAACLLTVSDSFITHQETTSEQRQNSFLNMVKIALGVVDL